MPKLNIILTVSNPDTWANRLKQIKELGANDGALFISPYESVSYFWNHGVEYPIDIAFYDKAKTQVYCTTMAANQERYITSPIPYKYVVETNANWFANNNLNKVGTHLNQVIDTL
jgi:uncharacterized membrane protein (UPF0127 family)